ncbi:MAG TPA: PIN domain-containing protein [Candidatus Paceibacterota bacterium]|nr:PIN domain-containing protein [Verrucomicrobiota bacterium]HRY51396.1 PIN domain-containing protein [Candidatus Paceibacterota bacterium]HSA00125.1 PIN domain-containing protein [Candidatus Paceibacterota bacterium]
MIAVDTNLLIYAHRVDSRFHPAAKEMLEILRRQTGLWSIPWPCVHEFIAVVTHPRIYRPPTPVALAFDAIDSWAAGGNLQFLAESTGYLKKLRHLALAAQLEGARIHDARIAALCLHHGVRELWTADRDFSAFPQLNTRNPLIKT